MASCKHQATYQHADLSASFLIGHAYQLMIVHGICSHTTPDAGHVLLSTILPCYAS